MGVPALFRWLSRKYPKIVAPTVEEQPRELNGITIPVDIGKTNPNGVEFDNLYLDMNGLVHPCCHPIDKPAPDTVEDMMVEIFKYIDRMMAIVRPRKVLYMAVDGVAPRAKMNQQRSRRFRAAQEAQEKAEAEEKLRQEKQDATGEDQSDTKEKFDSNCITPGTPFMTLLTKSIRYYVAYKLNNDPGWKNLKVIISDASVPGEGEHKIMNFIRSQRNSPDYDPNTRHVMYGLDADLIMLALATHEPHFTLLREDVFASEGDSTGCFICHIAANCTGSAADKAANIKSAAAGETEKPFVFLHVNILREYLEIELRREGAGFPFEFERAIDDWVFMCFFVGNDFLPHLPSLEIREGALDALIAIWKRVLPLMGGYVTEDGYINLTRAQYLLTELGKIEDKTFQDRREREERRMLAAKRRKIQIANAFRNGPAPFDNQSAAQKLKAALSGNTVPPAAETEDESLVDDAMEEEQATTTTTGEVEVDGEVDDGDKPSDTTSTEPAHAGQKRKLEESPNPSEVGIATPGATVTVAVGSGVDEADEASDAEPVDDVRMWESGFKERYYRQKFGVELSDDAFRREIIYKYVEGLCWGCPSWKWYYPYHYAPFASDFVDIASFDIQFELGTPFRPVEQLMGVLPAASRAHIPSPFHRLMTDPDSEIIDFYPVDFDLDMNGKKHLWQAVILLPFIDEQRLLNAMTPIYNEWTKMRNNAIVIDTKLSLRMSGMAAREKDFIPETTFQSPLKKHGYPDLMNNRALAVTYEMLTLSDGSRYKARLLPGIKFDTKVLTRDDIESVMNGPPQRGRGRGRGGNMGGGGYRGGHGYHGYNNHYNNQNTGYQRRPYQQRGGANHYNHNHNNSNYNNAPIHYSNMNYSMTPNYNSGYTPSTPNPSNNTMNMSTGYNTAMYNQPATQPPSNSWPNSYQYYNNSNTMGSNQYRSSTTGVANTATTTNSTNTNTNDPYFGYDTRRQQPHYHQHQHHQHQHHVPYYGGNNNRGGRGGGGGGGRGAGRGGIKWFN
ncbi:XRN 5'-3' exonuclease N-terminus-domain-containing protein [Syncephalis plumigaleata]|nr:XRN 5'-3' exonuclease N-terminus-domain-containing protein [Syncephalis plumigaleata]